LSQNNIILRVLDATADIIGYLREDESEKVLEYAVSKFAQGCGMGVLKADPDTLKNSGHDCETCPDDLKFACPLYQGMHPPRTHATFKAENVTRAPPYVR